MVLTMTNYRSALKGACSVLVILACGVVAPMASAKAQDASAFGSRLERLERDLMVLQRQIYRTKVQGEDVSAPSSGGSVATLTKLGEMEEQMRDLTGQIETLSFQIEQNKAQMERMQKDIDFRLRALEGKPLSAQNGQVAEGTLTQEDKQLAPGASVKPLAPTQGAIPVQPSNGTIKLTPPSGSSSVATKDALSPHDAYSAAFKLVQKGDYAAAEVAFQGFLKNHKDDPLAGNAQYWLGETYYVRGQYQKAAVTFADGYKTYRKSPKAADSLFKLGRSMQKLDKVPNACAAFGQLLKEFPKANKVTLQLAKSQRTALKCQ